jgi:hypothetical protein
VDQRTAGGLEELSILREVLAKQFDTPLVTGRLTAVQRSALRDLLEANFDTIASFY